VNVLPQNAFVVRAALWTPLQHFLKSSGGFWRREGSWQVGGGRGWEGQTL